MFSFFKKSCGSCYIVDCGSTTELDADVGGVITSLNYPNDYPNNKHCSWYIRSTTGNVKLAIPEFDVEKGDHVTVGDRWRVLRNMLLCHTQQKQLAIHDKYMYVYQAADNLRKHINAWDFSTLLDKRRRR